MSDGETPQTPPRIFISYAQVHACPCRAGILALARALAADGLDVELDQFHAQALIDWPRWCEECLRPESSNFVLMVCSAEYRRRIEGRVERDQGRGVFWEGNLIYGDLYRAKANERFVPFLLDDESEAALPPKAGDLCVPAVEGLQSGEPGQRGEVLEVCTRAIQQAQTRETGQEQCNVSYAFGIVCFVGSLPSP